MSDARIKRGMGGRMSARAGAGWHQEGRGRGTRLPAQDGAAFYLPGGRTSRRRGSASLESGRKRRRGVATGPEKFGRAGHGVGVKSSDGRRGWGLGGASGGSEKMLEIEDSVAGAERTKRTTLMSYAAIRRPG